MNNFSHLLSIIIPTYNRADLIGETLDSIIAQTYANWECIIVDDGSTENNINIIDEYCAKDPRFKLFERKKYNKPKGANACRNIGLEQCVGDYVIFFDSDDIMYNNHLEVKINAITLGDFDMVICKSKYFNNPKNTNPINYRGLFDFEINPENYITQKINWITFDPIIKSSIAKQTLFNENLQANQEYNYFSKLLFNVRKVKAIDIVLTDRRFDERSIQGSLARTNAYNDRAFHSFLQTYMEVYKLANKSSRQFLLNKIIETGYKNFNLIKGNKPFIYVNLLKEFGLLKGMNKIRILEFTKLIK
ncbi:glycosyltransferase family 2 protein [Faecalibacter rhinopitheci]|uniref:Glycosyltransferase family 2 protein n=1 Tax=Faecalibacter rhinopitheci TaxID=2779678 RepID=A0A8J7FW00_9FLAO|nr:glycosyltransferase family 2 protein [Faecalibacter rhinopitheci]MBF0597491.1 glycosyltransferase family 2 protein [Faecalibacter rhinopitheci]